MIIVVLEEVHMPFFFFFFVRRGQKSPLLGENYYCAGKKNVGKNDSIFTPVASLN